MKNYRLISGLVSLVLLAVMPRLLAADAATAVGPEYKLRPGDRISVMVFQEPKLALRNIPVGSGGEIQIAGVAKPLQVGGLSVREAMTMMQKAYEKSGLVNQPRVAITVESYAPKSKRGEREGRGEEAGEANRR